MNDPESIDQAKTKLRKKVLAKRKSLSLNERKQQSELIVKQLKKLAELADSETLAGYAPLVGEADILECLIFWTSIGRSVVLPRVDPESKKLHWHNICDWNADLTTGYRGIREPCLTLPEIKPTQIRAALIPSIAVDKQGNRLGFGGGFYDRNIPNLSNAILIAPVFNFQIFNQIPTNISDQKINIIVTSSSVLRCSR